MSAWLMTPCVQAAVAYACDRLFFHMTPQEQVDWQGNTSKAEAFCKQNIRVAALVGRHKARTMCPCSRMRQGMQLFVNATARVDERIHAGSAFSQLWTRVFVARELLGY
jgi:hypothetical protein